jgi:hypothetical protein
MSLEKWAEFGWLKTEPTSRDEIKNLLAIVDRDLKDASVAAVSQDRRFEAAQCGSNGRHNRTTSLWVSHLGSNWTSLEQYRVSRIHH